RAQCSTLFPYTTLFRSKDENGINGSASNGFDGNARTRAEAGQDDGQDAPCAGVADGPGGQRKRAQGSAGQAALVNNPRQHRKSRDRKSTRLNSSHDQMS